MPIYYVNIAKIHFFKCCILICMQNHNNDSIKTTSDTVLQKNIPLTLYERVECESELETEQNCNILTPTFMAISVVTFSFSRVAQPEARWPSSLLGAGFLYRILSPTGVVSKTNWHPVFTELYNSLIAHSISPHNWPPEYALPPSLEWHVWSSSSGNNCHAVHRSRSSGASVCDCIVGF